MRRVSFDDEPPKIRNGLINDIFNDVRKTLTKHQDISYEEIDIVINRLRDGILQSKIETMFQWLKSEDPNQSETKTPHNLYT